MKDFLHTPLSFPGKYTKHIPNKKEWRTATGTAEQLHTMAAFYLANINYDAAHHVELEEMTLAKAVCNVRYFHQQSLEATIKLIQQYYNPHMMVPWHDSIIRQMWYDVEGYTPDLGLRHKDAIKAHNNADMEKEVEYFLEDYTKAGGRVETHILYDLFCETYLDIQITYYKFGQAVRKALGIRKNDQSDGVSYFPGRHLPC